MNRIFNIHKIIGEMADYSYYGGSPERIEKGAQKPIPNQRWKPVSLQNLQPIFNC